jgi:hypothetical protein
MTDLSYVPLCSSIASGRVERKRYRDAESAARQVRALERSMGNETFRSDTNYLMMGWHNTKENMKFIGLPGLKKTSEQFLRNFSRYSRSETMARGPNRRRVKIANLAYARG